MPASDVPHHRTEKLRSLVPEGTSVKEIRYDCRLPVADQLGQVASQLNPYDPNSNDVLVGHSLGALYALVMEQHARIRRLILLNPSLIPHVTLREQLSSVDEMRRVTRDQLSDWHAIYTDIVYSRTSALTGVAVLCDGDEKLRLHYPMFCAMLAKRGMSVQFASGGTHSAIPDSALVNAIHRELMTTIS